MGVCQSKTENHDEKESVREGAQDDYASELDESVRAWLESMGLLTRLGPALAKQGYVDEWSMERLGSDDISAIEQAYGSRLLPAWRKKLLSWAKSTTGSTATDASQWREQGHQAVPIMISRSVSARGGQFADKGVIAKLDAEPCKKDKAVGSQPGLRAERIDRGVHCALLQAERFPNGALKRGNNERRDAKEEAREGQEKLEEKGQPEAGGEGRNVQQAVDEATPSDEEFGVREWERELDRVGREVEERVEAARRGNHPKRAFSLAQEDGKSPPQMQRRLGQVHGDVLERVRAAKAFSR